MNPSDVYMIAYLVSKGIKPPMIDKLMSDPFLECCNDVREKFSSKLNIAYQEAYNKDIDNGTD